MVETVEDQLLVVLVVVEVQLLLVLLVDLLVQKLVELVVLVLDLKIMYGVQERVYALLVFNILQAVDPVVDYAHLL